MGPVPPVPATQPQYFDIPLTEPINQGASAAHFLPQQHIAYRVFPEDTKSKNKVYLSAESDLARRAIRKAVSIFWFWSDIRGICTMPALYVVACRVPSSHPSVAVTRTGWTLSPPDSKLFTLRLCVR